MVIDEIGPIELCSSIFIEAINNAFDSEKSVLATSDFRSKHQVIESLKGREDVEIYRIGENNRGEVLKTVVGLLV